jgi:predicted transcriptional regulator
MNRRTLYIGIASKGYIHKRMLAIAKGEQKQHPNDPCIWFTSFEALARVFSKANIMLIEILREKDPASITELAKAAGKEKTNVLRSLKILEEFEIIEFEEGEGGRKAPRLKYDDFQTRLYPRRGRTVH